MKPTGRDWGGGAHDASVPALVQGLLCQIEAGFRVYDRVA